MIAVRLGLQFPHLPSNADGRVCVKRSRSVNPIGMVLPEIEVNIQNSEELFDYLRTRGRLRSGELPKCRMLTGGVSNRTVLVTRASGESLVLKQALAELRVADHWFSPPERILREAAGMTALGRLAPRGSIPGLLFTDSDNYVLAMEAVPEPHENWKTVLLTERVEMGHVEQFAKLLAAIHRGGTDREFRQAFGDWSFFESLRIEPYYLTTASRVLPAAAFLHRLVEQTRARQIALVHGDYSPKNILIYNRQFVLLDHECIHFGDPAFDVGFSIAHLLSKANHLERARPALAAAVEHYWEVYRQGRGLAEELPTISHTLACLLARVAGRSRLEYLGEGKRSRQQAAVLALLPNPPSSVSELTERFLESL